MASCLTQIDQNNPLLSVSPAHILHISTPLNFTVFYSIPLICLARNGFHARQTCKQKTNILFETKLLYITPIKKSCLIFALILFFVDIVFWSWLLFRIIIAEIAYIWSRFGKVCRGKMSTILHCEITALCDIFLETNKHQYLMRTRFPIGVIAWRQNKK